MAVENRTALFLLASKDQKSDLQFDGLRAYAELESSLISERVKAGMKAAKARGKHLGRPRTSESFIA